MDLVRLGLERAHTADDALDVITTLLEEHGQGGSGERDRDEPYFSSFLIADSTGGWILETSGRTWAARPIDHGAAISNRLTLAVDWTRASADVAPGRSFDEWRSDRIPTSIADHRLAATRATAISGGGLVGPRELVATMRDHGQGPWGAPGDRGGVHPPPTELGDDGRGITVCMHIRGFQATTASMVAAVGDGSTRPRAWVCLGSPCVGVYLPVFIDAVPVELGDPAQWERFAHLRDRVDAAPDGEALATIRDVLGAIESELWDEADEVAITGDLDRRIEFAHVAWKPVDAALAALGV
jgi:hypothetical protein